MNIGELILELQKHDYSTKVVVRGYEMGYNNVLELKPLMLQESDYRTDSYE